MAALAEVARHWTPATSARLASAGATRAYRAEKLAQWAMFNVPRAGTMPM